MSKDEGYRLIKLPCGDSFVFHYFGSCQLYSMKEGNLELLDVNAGDFFDNVFMLEEEVDRNSIDLEQGLLNKIAMEFVLKDYFYNPEKCLLSFTLSSYDARLGVDVGCLSRLSNSSVEDVEKFLELTKPVLDSNKDLLYRIFY